nr:cytochrome P450 [Tanacetum cinerariifolium]
GACVFTDKWSLDELANDVPTDGPYQTNPPSPDDIISSIRIDREGQVCRIYHEEDIDVLEYQVRTQEIKPTMKPLEEIIWEHIFCLRDVPHIPLNPQPLQSHPSLDITLSLSPFTPLDHIHDTPSPPSPSQPQPPIMGYPLYYNYHDYHGSNCICYFHNRTLFLTLRDKMNIVFTHLEYLLTTAITSHFPPPP